MAVLSELFSANHARALTRASALDAGLDPDEAPHLELTGITALDLESLGEIAADVVHFGTGDVECEEVDLDHDNLVELPPFLVDVLVELGVSEDPEALADVAARWAATEDLGIDADTVQAVLSDVVALVTIAKREDRSVYLWVEQLP